MPTSPFAEEHEALRSTVRRLVAERLVPLAAAAEGGEPVQADAVGLCCDLLGVHDVLAGVVIAEELGRLRSGGLLAVLLDAALLADVGLDGGPGAVARRGDVQIAGGEAHGYLPMVIGGAAAGRVLVLASGVVVELSGNCDIEPAGAVHALRGGGLADVVVRGASCRSVEINRKALQLAELREAAAAVGGAWQTFEDAHTYAGQRLAFGRPIGSFQVNRHALAELATWLTAAEALVHDTAWAMANERDPSSADTAAARLFAGRTARRVAEVGLQLHGGYGYTMDFDVQRAWRDTRALAIDDGDRQALVLSQRGGAA